MNRNKKPFLSLAALTLAVAAAFIALSGCSKDARDAKNENLEPTLAPTPTPEPTSDPGELSRIAGEWQSELDISEIYISALSKDDPDIAENSGAEHTPVKLYVKFESDGSYIYDMDRVSYEAALNEFADIILPYLKKTITESVGAYAQSMSEAELMSFLGIESWDAVKDEFLAEFESAELTEEGRFRIENGVIELTPTSGADASSFEYAFEGETLVLTPKMGANELAELPEGALTLRLTRME